MNMSRQGIRVAIGHFSELTEEMLRFASQIGVSGIQLRVPNIPGDTHWEEADLRALVERAAVHGLALETIENVPIHFYNKAMLGVAGRDEQIENYCVTVRNMGRAGVPILGLHFMPNAVWRTDPGAPGRGGSRHAKFDMDEIDGKTKEQWRGFMRAKSSDPDVVPLFSAAEGVVTADKMFDNYCYFMDAVLPVAEEAGVRIALHPDDPPVPMLGGIARIFKEPADFKRAWERYRNSPSWGLDLCLGCCSEMVGGADSVREMIRFFGPRGRIFYVHFRDVQGTVPSFQECFLGEGNFDPAEIMQLLRRSGFTGFLLDDHVPQMDNDTSWHHRGHAHAIGYMQGLLKMGERLPA